MIKQPGATTSTAPAIAIAFACGVALLVGSLLASILAGFLGAGLADLLNLGGDSAAFGEGADGFVVGAFFGFLISFTVGGFFVAAAISRALAVRLLIPLIAVFAPLACVLLFLVAAL